MQANPAMICTKSIHKPAKVYVGCQVCRRPRCGKWAPPHVSKSCNCLSKLRPHNIVCDMGLTPRPLDKPRQTSTSQSATQIHFPNRPKWPVWRSLASTRTCGCRSRGRKDGHRRCPLPMLLRLFSREAHHQVAVEWLMAKAGAPNPGPKCSIARGPTSSHRIARRLCAGPRAGLRSHGGRAIGWVARVRGLARLPATWAIVFSSGRGARKWNTRA